MKFIYTIVAFGLTSVAAFAEDAPKPKPAASLDDELFKDLDDATTAPGVKPKADTPKPDATKPGTTPPKAAGSKPVPAPTNPLDEELLRALEGDDAPSKPKSKPSSGGDGGKEGEGKSKTTKSASDDPFVRLTEQIREVEERLRRAESGDETQQQQKKIVDDLEKLIAQIEQQQQQQQSKSEPKPGEKQPKPGSQTQQQNQPQQGGNQESTQAKDSQEGVRNSTARKADMGNLKSLLEKAWGSLPERERQAVMQTSVDDFPAKYQFVIEEYFKTLLKREE